MIKIKTKGFSWIPSDDLDFYGFCGENRDSFAAVQYYNDKITKRRKEYPWYSAILQPEAATCAEEVRINGYHKIENFFNQEQKDILLEAKGTILSYINENEHIKPQKDQNMVFVNQPILNIPNLYKIIFCDNIINLATSYFNCIPAVTSVAVRKSFVTNGAISDNQYFHRDYNSLVKLFKVVVYFNDVDEGGGPFSYVKGSVRKMIHDWWDYPGLKDDFLEIAYGKENIKYLTANFGDVIVADTRGYHKGLKPKSKERLAMHICFLIHPELTGENHEHEAASEDWFRIREEDYNSLPDWKKPVADMLRKV